MFRIIITIMLVGAFFILFFKPSYNLKNKTVPEPSTTAGFVEDTYRGPITDRFIPPKYGEDIGTFVAYSTIPEDHWLSGFPQGRAEPQSYEDADTKLSRRIRELTYSGE